MKLNFQLSSVPQEPGIYVCFGMTGRAVYVGFSTSLRSRFEQHFVRRDSSVTTGASPAVMNADKIREVRYWLHPSFSDTDRLQAAELLAADVIRPVLRSRGRVSKAAQRYHGDAGFKDEMRSLFENEPSGVFHPPNLINLFLKVEELEKEVLRLQRNSQENRKVRPASRHRV